LEAETAWKGETINYRKDGTPYRLQWNVAPVHDKDGSVEYWVSTQRDVTEEREREAALRRQKALLEQTQRLAGAWEVDLRTGDLSWSKEVYRIHEIEPGTELTAEETLQFCESEARPRIEEALERCVEEGATYDLELPIRTAEGTRRWVRTVGAPAETAEGEVVKVAGAFQDITEQKEAERELQERETRLRGLANSIPGVVFQSGSLSDGERGTHFVGEAAEDILGLKADSEDFRERFLACIPESHREDLVRSLDTATDAERPWQFEAPFDRPDGERIWIYGTSTPTWQDGELIYNGVLLDIPEREENRRTLEQYRLYTGRLLDAIEDLFFVIDEEARFRRWNNSIPKVTGYDEREIGEMTAFDLVPEREHERLAKTIAEGFKEGHAQIEAPLLLKDGATLPYEFVGNLVEHPEGGLRAVGIGRDITERRRRKQKLERQNDLFSMAQSMAQVGGGEYDVQTGDNMVTDEVKRIHGLSPDDELTPERSISFYHPDDRATIREAFTRAVEEAEPYDLELRLITAEGEQRWIQTQGKPQFEDGEVIRVRGATQDVTERVRRRKELEEAKKAAEEGNRIKSALLSNMNHEFRTPLTSIITFSELIRDNPEIAGRFVDRILGGGKRLLYTLNTVMDFAELEGSGPSVTPKPCRPRDVVHSVVSDFRDEARRKGIELSIEFRERMGTVTLDEHLVERILTHLVHNAIKFTDDGSVTISARTGDALTLCVKDTGVGIDSDFLSQVFDEFMQVSSGYDRTHEGNGLGLTIVKRHVDAMGGTIDIESAPGEGTQVTVRLPTKDAAGL
jgi:PAS domain S-box-containing protein